jgi:hypothetical protein
MSENCEKCIYDNKFECIFCGREKIREEEDGLNV